MLNNEKVKVRSGISEILTGKVGVILGYSSELPVVGKSYLVDFGYELSTIYPYQCVTIPEIFLERLEA